MEKRDNTGNGCDKMENRERKNVYDGILNFQGKWRSYQERVLNESAGYLDDGKIHIVAAPGAGKTTLGIELIRRTGRPCLILSPRIVIRRQWLERITDSFLCAGALPEKGKTEGGTSLLSEDIRRPGMITSITYQTLYSAMAGLKNVEETAEESGETEEEDFAGFEFVRQVKSAGIGTVCLDECHHLKNEWWKALENFMGEMEGEGVTVIALTATPPYDSTPAQWERYTKMCGPVDAEIAVPELVREGSLCPHQDYVWFNVPSEDEAEEIRSFRESAGQALRFLMTDQSLREAAATHPALKDYDGYFDRMLEKPGYLSGLLSYCQASGIPFSGKWLKILGVSRMPEMSGKWMEYFLQGFLFDDADSYRTTEQYRKALLGQLKSAGLTERKNVRFLANEKIEKMLVNSRGKLESILRIASCEHTAMGERLRMLILTDYIRSEYRSAIGDAEKTPGIMGVLPIFELLRRRGAGWRLGVLCGSIVVIPDAARTAFEAELDKAAPGQKPEFREFRDVKGVGLGYSEVRAGGRAGACTRAVTELFEQGFIQILVGTKSLLGEGWDSQGINSLVMASTVGSYVLGNQMRGRAIRINRNDPDKVSNIWHLVCMSTPQEEADRRCMGIEEPEMSDDFRTLERRMEGVLGVSYDGTVIENGIRRLTTIRHPFTRKHIGEINEETARRSADRISVAGQWRQAVCACEKMEVAEEYRSSGKKFRPGVLFFHALGAQILLILAELLNILRLVMFRGLLPDLTFYAVTGIFLLLSMVFGGKLIRQLTPMWRFRGISRGVLKALQKAGQITSECRVMSEEEDGVWFCAWLQGGTDREKHVYADALSEMLSPVENQRYLLCHGGKKERPREYFCVPGVFAGTRGKAELFQKELIPYIGRFHLVYTRSPEGRKTLLYARARAFANRNAQHADRKRQVRGALE